MRGTELLETSFVTNRKSYEVISQALHRKNGLLTSSKGHSSSNNAHSSSSMRKRLKRTPFLLLNSPSLQRSLNTGRRISARPIISATEFQRVGTERRRICSLIGAGLSSWSTWPEQS